MSQTDPGFVSISGYAKPAPVPKMCSMPRFRSTLVQAAVLALAPAFAPAVAGQNPALVQTRVSEFLQERASVLPGTPQITVTADNVERYDACESLEVFLAGNGKLRPRMSVGVRCNAPTPWTTYVQTSIQVTGTYFVAARGISAGQRIGPDDLAAREGDLMALPQGAVVDASRLDGAVATRRINAGTTLRTNALRSAESVQRGRTVRLVVNGRGFVATSEGEAMGSAAPGSYVQVRTASGQIVSGIVRDASTVEVPM